MTIVDKFRDKNLQFNINSEAANILALSSGKIDQQEYLACEKILPCGQSKIIEQAKSTNSQLVKTFEIQIKAIENKEKAKLQLQNF